MKTALFAALALCVPLTLLADGPDSAYQALRVVGAQRGADILSHVIEVEGRGGVPEPAVWRVVLDDPSARGGVRELDVSHGKIVGEHTPVGAYSGSAAGALIDLHKLNLDSSGAFTITEKEAQTAHIGFDSVDYILRTGDGPNANPVWVIHVMDENHRDIGTMTLAADTGAIVNSNINGHPQQDVGNVPPPPPAPPEYADQNDQDNVYATGTYPAAPPPPEDPNDPDDTQGLHIGHKIKQVIVSAGQSLKNFVTGRDFTGHQDNQ